jgi:hypothetical protein
MSHISFHVDVLEKLLIVEDFRILKPGIDKEAMDVFLSWRLDFLRSTDPMSDKEKWNRYRVKLSYNKLNKKSLNSSEGLFNARQKSALAWKNQGH